MNAEYQRLVLSPARYLFFVVALLLTGNCLSHAASSTVTLHLKAANLTDSERSALGLSKPPRVPIPPGEIEIKVPLYQGAIQDLQATGYGGSSTRAYEKFAAGAYRIPVDRDTAIEWYNKEFDALGYSKTPDNPYYWYNGTGQLSKSRQLEFASPKESDQHYIVRLTMQHEGNVTVVSYFASAITVPPRPADSLIPGNIVLAEVTRHVDVTADEPEQVGDIWVERAGYSVRTTVTDSKDIARLVAALNTLPVDGAQGMILGTIGGYHWEITFFSKDGTKYVSNVDPSCFRACSRGYTLYDGGRALNCILNELNIPPKHVIDAALDVKPIKFTLHQKLGFYSPHSERQQQWSSGSEQQMVSADAATVDVALPLYPGAIKEPLRKATVVTTCPPSPYVKSALAVYGVPGDRERLLDWYKKAFSDMHYSTFGDFRGSPESRSIHFSRKDQPHTDSSVTITLKQDGDRALVSYVAWSLATPPRPRDSLIQGDIAKVEVTRTILSRTNCLTKTISEPKDVAALVAAFNAIPMPCIPQQRTLPDSHNYSWDLVFINNEGKKVETEMSAAGLWLSVSFNDYTFRESRGQVDGLLGAITKAWGY